MNLIEKLEFLQDDTYSESVSEILGEAIEKIKELEGKIEQLTTTLNHVERDEFMIKHVYNLACQGVSPTMHADGQVGVANSKWFDLANVMMDIWPDLLINFDD